MGGKLGDQVAEAFGSEKVEDLLKVPIEILKTKVDAETATWLFKLIRGEDYSEVSSRTEIKSMLSAKSFRPAVTTWEQAIRWLRIFAADIFFRLVEEGVLENRRRPKTINLHHRHAGQTRSRQAVIPSGKKIDEMMLFELAKTLMRQTLAENQVWPCSNLSLSVGGFEDGPTGNRGIGSFLLKGDEAKVMSLGAQQHGRLESADEHDRPVKRQRTGEDGIQRFLARSETTSADSEEQDTLNETTPYHMNEYLGGETAAAQSSGLSPNLLGSGPACQVGDSTEHRSLQANQGQCERCGKILPVEDMDEHNDWHFAKDLQASEHRPNGVNPSPAVTSNGNGLQLSAQPKAKKKSEAGKREKGQKRLAF